MTPNALAATLVGAAHAEAYGKRFVRPYLRRHFSRDVALKGAGWTLSDAMIAEVTAAHKAREAGKPFDTAAWRKARNARKRKPKASE